MALVLTLGPRALTRPRTWIGPLALILIATLALSACGSSPPSSSPARRAPVITEHFTRLACTPSTTIGLEGCAEGRLLAGDRRLNAEVALLFSLVPRLQRTALVASQAAFLRYRRATCTTYSDVFQGGTIQPVEFADCEARLDTSQSTVLHGYFRLAEEGARRLPAWP